MLFQKKIQTGIEDMEFSGVEHAEIPGVKLKKEVEFPGVRSRKNHAAHVARISMDDGLHSPVSLSSREKDPMYSCLCGARTRTPICFLFLIIFCLKHSKT